MHKFLTKKYLFIILSFSFLWNCAQQSYRDIPNEIVKQGYTKYNTYDEDIIYNQYFRNGIKAEHYLPDNYSRKGDRDYTDYIQKAVQSGNTIIMPAFPIMVNEKGIQLKSNTKIFFPKGSQILMKPNDKAGYQALLLKNVKNIELYFPVIKGDRKQHTGKEGEWGMGILIRNGENIKIVNPQISECWGDGIYIGAEDNKKTSNILVDNALLDYNRRNGISVISGNNITIKNSLIANTIGTPPNFGIDLEPNNNTNVLENIILTNNSTYNNKVGVGIVLDQLIGKNIQSIGVAIDNHTDYKSANGVEFFVDRGYSKFNNNNLTGKISIKNLQTFDAGNAVVLNKSKAVPNLIITVNKIVSQNQGKTTKTSISNIQTFNTAVQKGQKVILQ